MELNIQNTTIFLCLFVLFIGIELIYFKIASKYNFIDKPNDRSSHTYITLRGGGVLFPIAIACCMSYVSWLVVLAVVLVATISFIDDIKPLHQLPRFLSHLVAVTLLILDLSLFSTYIWMLLFIYILMIGWINAFNFMDGINGITVLYSLVSIITFALMPIHEDSLFLFITVGLSCIVFAYFNIRKRAKTFAGDVGSISMAVFLGYFMIKTILITQNFNYTFFFSVYAIDAVITIIYRLKRKENIFESHRSHLYQYLVNEKKHSHLVVSFSYALIQIIINCLIIKKLDGKYFSISDFIFSSIFLGGVYVIVRYRVTKNFKNKVYN